MKILHLLGSATDEASGPTYSVQSLAREQALQGCHTNLFSQNGKPLAKSFNFEHRTFPVMPGMQRFLHSPQMNAAMGSMRVDIVHNHAMWMAQGLYGLSMRRRGNARALVTSPRGSLAPYAMRHNRWRKSVMWPLQHRVLAESDLLHATADHELEDIRRMGFRQPVALISNGVDLRAQLPAREERMFGAARTLLYLGRIHPLKGLDELLDAWGRVSCGHPDWQLAIAGPTPVTGGYDLEDGIARHGLERVKVTGPLYGEDKARAYREAELYVLPSRGENFGITIAEALAQGTPVIACHGAPWRVLEERGAGWWIPQGARSLVQCLDVALAKPAEELTQIGRRGLKLVTEEFAWPTLANKMMTAYSYALGQGDRPGWVHLP